MTGFGAKLREIRRQRGISQGALGAGTFSASYISHLERGTRRPTPDVVRFLADRLSVPAHSLIPREDEHINTDDVSRAVAQIALHSSIMQHEYSGTLSSTALLATVSASASERFAVRRLTAEALLAGGSYAACIEAADELLGTAIAASSPVLRAVALALRSRALRADGRLVEALHSAADAVRNVRTSDTVPATISVGALTSAIAASAELGRSHELAAFVAELTTLKPTLPEGHSRALAAWSLGNVAFDQGDIPTALREHDEAARLLNPEADLRAWARFYKATAALRLAAGIDHEIDVLIGRAAHGLAIVGNSADLAELDLLRAERLLRDDPTQSMSIIADVLDRERLPGQTVAHAHRMRALAFATLGDEESSVEALLQAAQAYVESGATEKARETWQLLVEIQRAGHGSVATSQLDADAAGTSSASHRP